MSKEKPVKEFNELEEFILRLMDEFRLVISEGQESLGIPVLDPFKTSLKVHEEFSFKKGTGSLTMNDPVITGLGTLKGLDFPVADLKQRTLSFAIMFDQLSLESEDFSFDGEFRPLFLKHRISKSGRFRFQISEIRLFENFRIDIENDAPIIRDNGSRCEIDDMEIDIEKDFLIDLITPFFKSTVENLFIEKVQRYLGRLINTRLQEYFSAQAAAVNRLKTLAAIKREQGFDTVGDGKADKPRLLHGLGGVGQLPPPAFWELPAVDVPNVPHIALDELVRTAKTGDVILFAGSYPSSKRIRRLTQSCFSHVIIVIREPDIADGRTCIWQATSSTHEGVLRDMVPKSGIQLNYLEDMIHDYLREDAGAVICWRRLVRPMRPEDEEQAAWEKLKAFIMEMDSKPYTNDMDGLYIMGLMEIDHANKEDYFCAGLVAESFMRLGILKNTFYQYQYAPRDFSELQPTLPFNDEATHFEQEVVIDVGQ